MSATLIHSLSTGFALLTALGALGLALYVKRLILRDFPGRTTINELRREVAEFSGEVADLTERFARFQKREGMRSARDQKEVNQGIQAQAMEILAQAGAQTPGSVPGGDTAAIKAELRRRLRQ